MRRLVWIFGLFLAFVSKANPCTRTNSWPGGSQFQCVLSQSYAGVSTTGWLLRFTLNARITQIWNGAEKSDPGATDKLVANLDYNADFTKGVEFGFLTDNQNAVMNEPSISLAYSSTPPVAPPLGPVVNVPTPVPTAPPAPEVLPDPAVILPAAGYYSTRGKRIINSLGTEVRFRGISWFGFETDTKVVHGLWARNYKDYLNLIKSLGFNLVRLPFSNSILRAGATVNSINYALNPDLVGLTPLQVMDKIIAFANSLGLKVMLDRHRPEQNAQSELWYTPQVSEAVWINDWVALARRYRSQPAVVAVDLHNEPHNAAQWGNGNTATDWRLAAQRAGNAIHAVHPHLLIVVEGVQSSPAGWYWWGGNLSEAGAKPVQLTQANKVVYSPHDYPASISGQSWFQAGNYPANLPAVWDLYWGYLMRQNRAPVLVGEFGTKLLTPTDRLWLETLTAYLKSTGASFVFWSLNPNSGDTGGILQDDWRTVDQTKLNLLKRAW